MDSLQASDTTKILPENKFTFGLYQAFTDSLKANHFNIYSFKQSHIEGNITLDKPKILFFSIPFDEGWKIYVDKKEEKLLRANIGFSGILLQTGHHEIVINFVPQYSVIQTLISIITIILFWLYLIYSLIIHWKRKR
jgi:uncharacterized membrane protein YfhO